MNLTTLITLKLWQWTFLAQAVTPGVGTSNATPVLFSGPQFFIALISGILLAFAIQLLLTNFSVAAGISYLGTFTSPHSDRHHSDHHDNDDSDSGSTIRKISLGVGLWTLISVSIALFFACYLAVQLSLLATPRLGAIIGLVIWAAYFSLLVWVSSTTVGSLIGSVVQTATSGFQAILGTATAAIGGQAAKRQAVSTAEAVAAAVRNELGAGIDPDSIRESVEKYVKNLSLPGLDLGRIRSDLEGLLNDPEVASLADSGQLQNIDRQAFLDLVSQRTDLSKQEVNRLADLLEGIWQQTLGRRRSQDHTAELANYLRSTQSGQLKVDELNAKIDRLLAERSGQSGQQSGTSQAGIGLPNISLQSGLSAIIPLLMGRSDLNDVNLGQILQRLRSVSGNVADQTQNLVHQVSSSEPSYNPIEADVEDYLLHTYSWQMDRTKIAAEFRSILYDPNADPNAVIEAVSRLNRARFVELLASRGVFTQAQIQSIADQLESIRLEVLAQAKAEQERETRQDLRQRVQNYLTTTPKQELVTAIDLPAFKDLLEDADAEPDALRQRFTEYNRADLERILQQRQDLTDSERQAILDTLERTRDRVLFESQSLYDQSKQRYSELQQKLEGYLRNTGKAELNPEGIKRDLQLLAQDPTTGVSALRHRAAQFDRDTLVQLLSQRQDLSQSEANQILNQVESTWNSIVNAPSAAVQVVQDQYDQTLTTLADYLRRTNLEELDPDGIQRDLKTLFENPKEGSLALRRRLSKVDRQTLVRLLSQRQDMSEAQANQTIDHVLNTIQDIIRSPRRLALRTQQQVSNFESSLEEYLRNTQKEELNPDGIKRDLGLLVNSPRLGIQNLGERLSQVDRSTVIALLSQRQDITPAEAERIVSNIEAVRDQMLTQVKQVQARIQSVIEGIFDRIRSYLNSLDRPELNYEGIRQDVRTLFDDPQAGFEALRSRLSQVDRGTLVALLSSRDDISEASANRIVDQIESARTGVLQRAERIQTEAQRRLEAVKLQTQRQLNETRKAAATAAWWLFATALVSAAAAAVGGTLAAS
jgi:nucleoid DNA-binding protein